ncbi:hypothetical protein MPER_02217 [Moniliophthora perniciosa FA553]|nr:hypothetical protein MPER_02217 [Moniliophthora perniciosa FA553]
MISRATVLGAFLVDLVPSRVVKYLPSWAPFASFHRVGSHGRSLIAKLVESPFQHVKDKIAQGTAPPSFARDVMLKPELDGERTDQDVFEHNVKWACASMYAAGQEVISSSILNMIMAMAKYPKKMKIAQAELDAVVGADRYPNIADRENLPYFTPS